MLKKNLLAALFVASLYIFVANVVFALRHPWATDTERFLYMREVLTFQRVPYEEVKRLY